MNLRYVNEGAALLVMPTLPTRAHLGSAVQMINVISNKRPSQSSDPYSQMGPRTSRACIFMKDEVGGGRRGTRGMLLDQTLTEFFGILN